MDKAVFKNSMGVLKLKKLFLETNSTLENRDLVVYTLKDRDHIGYPSIPRLYLETKDPGEYRFANLYFYNWDHWYRLTETDWFQPYLKKMRAELAALMKSEALDRILAKADQGDFQANKYLLERKWTTVSKGVGRPNKPEQELVRVDYDDDYNRLEVELENGN